jgi:hypothetical protein
MKRYFMSYVFRYIRNQTGPAYYGSSVLDRDEHPVAVVNRWNERYTDRVTVLLHWCEVGADVPEMDVVT